MVGWIRVQFESIEKAANVKFKKIIYYGKILIKLSFFSKNSETQSFIEPYKAALNDIESQVTEQSEKIANVKRKIILNEEKINKLIFNVGKNI